jgi:sec-independent protein translocase protein TatC
VTIGGKPPGFFEQSGSGADYPSLDSGSDTPESSRQAGPEHSASVGTSVSASLALPLTSHLAELRNRVLISAATLATTTGFGFYQAETVIGWLKALAPRNTLFIQLTMGEVLMATLAVSLQIGLTLASPVLLYHVLRFVNPGLHRREQVMLTWTLLGGTGLFLTGVAFAYLFVLGPAIDFLLAFGQPIAHPSLSIREFIGFCSGLLLVTGLMFELPMVLFLLSFTGLITSARLIREWRWATVLIFIVAAIVTPTQDPLSLSIVGLAMVALYALSIIPIRLCGR